MIALDEMINGVSEPGGERSFGDIRRDAEAFATLVPESMVPLAHYAAFWGISDDIYRIDFIDVAPMTLLKDLVGVIFDESNYTVVDAWMKDCEKDGSWKSEVYQAYATMIFAADQANAIIVKLK